MNEPQSEAHIFIDENIDIHEGDRAIALLSAKAEREAEVIDPHRGVVRVDRVRWEEAQRYERRTWLEKGRSVTTDRNEYHRERFANYAPLRGLEFEQGIELGCGPFTNMRLILEHCKVKRVHFLDPLLQDYLTHPSCRYRTGRLGGVLKNMPTWYDLYNLRHPFLFWQDRINAYRTGGLWGKPISLNPSTIEAYQTDLRFDLVVMINVMEHCQDADTIFNKILKILLPGGIFVYGDVMYEASEVRRLSSIIYDAGHPLRVDRTVVTEFLSRNFEPWLQAEYLLERNFRGVHLNNQELYFIGKKTRDC